MALLTQPQPDELQCDSTRRFKDGSRELTYKFQLSAFEPEELTIRVSRLYPHVLSVGVGRCRKRLTLVKTFVVCLLEDTLVVFGGQPNVAPLRLSRASTFFLFGSNRHNLRSPGSSLPHNKGRAHGLPLEGSVLSVGQQCTWRGRPPSTNKGWSPPASNLGSSHR